MKNNNTAIFENSARRTPHFAVTSRWPGTSDSRAHEFMGAVHLVKISGISGSAVNGTRFVGSSNWKIPRKVENLKRLSRFPGWNFRTECRVPFTFLVVCTSSRSTVGHRATYRGLRPNGTTFYQSQIPLLLPPKFPGFFRKWKAPLISHPLADKINSEHLPIAETIIQGHAKIALYIQMNRHVFYKHSGRFVGCYVLFPYISFIDIPFN